MDKIVISIVGLVVIGGIGWYVVAGQKGEDAMMQKEDGAMMENEGGAMQKDEGAMMDEKEEAGGAMMQKGTYEAYSDDKLALAAEGDVLLFFHADWCPICRAIESEIEAGAAIPASVHILKVDFDTATALRQKYGVTVQHTFVQVDSSGSLMQKFSDAMTLSAVLGRVK